MKVVYTPNKIDSIKTPILLDGICNYYNYEELIFIEKYKAGKLIYEQNCNPYDKIDYILYFDSLYKGIKFSYLCEEYRNGQLYLKQFLKNNKTISEIIYFTDPKNKNGK